MSRARFSLGGRTIIRLATLCVALLVVPAAAMAEATSTVPAPAGGAAATLGPARPQLGTGFADGKAHERIRPADADGPAPPGDYPIPARHGHPPLPAHA